MLYEVITLYGPRMDYTVDFYSEKAETVQEAPETMYVYNTEIAPDGTPIAPGAAYEYTKPIAGNTFNVYKTRYDLEGKQIDTVLYEKSYNFV